jgi:CarboxypepD_reg-like domain
MKNYLLFILIVSFALINSNTVFCQVPNPANENAIQLKGVIIEEDTKSLLAYVNIGIPGKPMGTVSDSTGKFSFIITKENLPDSILVSLTGYQSKKLAISDFIAAADKTILLSIKYSALKEVIVSNRKTRTVIIGRQSESKLIQVSIHNKTSVDATIGSEMGMLMKNNRAGTMLKDLNWYISSNNFDQIKFRVNIYSIKDDLPDTLICNKQIFAIADKFQTGWLRIDLEPYDIRIDGDFIITLQWIESRMDKKENPVTLVPIAITAFAKNAYARIASQDKWKKLAVKFSCYVTLTY